MIKITIIVILILLLLITLYSYYCLSSSMENFEQKRMEYILNKESELKKIESRIKIDSECLNKNQKYQTAIKGINDIIDKLNLPPGSICAKYSNEDDKNTIQTIKSIILENKPEQTNSLQIPQPSSEIVHDEYSEHDDYSKIEQTNQNMESNQEEIIEIEEII